MKKIKILFLCMALSITTAFAQYDATKSLPSGYKTNGTVDYTTHIQNAINANQVVNMPAFPVMISDVGINIPSNRTINFPAGAKIVMKASSLSSYKILNISGRENVTINNPVIEGDRNIHIGESGESGLLIAIMGSKNVTINGGLLTNAWADGIYVGTKTVSGIANTPSSNITIKDVKILNSRRNGISIISVVGCTIDNAYIAYSGGGTRFHDPQSGLGFEPNFRADRLEGIKVNNLVTVGNFNHGVYCGVSQWYKEAASSTATTKVMDITITNWQDTKSGMPLLLSWNRAAFPTSTLTNISGAFKVLNPQWTFLSNKSKLIEQYVNQPVGGIQLIISKVKVAKMSPTAIKIPQLETIANTKTYVTSSFGNSANLTVIDR